MVKFVMSVPIQGGLLSAAVAFAGLILSGNVDAARAQQFSADIVVEREGGKAPAGRVFVLDGKTRIETPEFGDGFFLVDRTRQTAYFVRRGGRVYMDARQSSPLTRLLVPVDPDDPCRQWQAMAGVAGIEEQGDLHCERAGEETIGDHDSLVFRVASGSREIFLGWVDRARGFPLRIKTAAGIVTSLENVRDEPQLAASFELPPNARKFSPEALIERIKQSDVWVSEPQDEISAHR
jgi:hypothetical protein